MRRHRKLLGLSAAVLLAASTLTAPAASMKTLQGAWTAEGLACDQVFEKSAGHVRFKEHDGVKMQGVIVSGNKIVGPSASCTAHNIVPKKDHLSIKLQCADAVLATDLSVAFKFTDANHFVRMDPFFPGNTYGYHKCDM